MYLIVLVLLLINKLPSCLQQSVLSRKSYRVIPEALRNQCRQFRDSYTIQIIVQS
ncbi:hypothetical protein D1872_313890 [compost metagenome]